MEVGFEPIDTYIWRRKNLVAQYIATQYLLDLCKAAERNQGEQVGIRWWEQVLIDLTGASETAAVTVDEGGLEE